MTFDWNYMFGLLGDAEFWRATWTVIKLSTLTWVLSIGLGFLLALAYEPGADLPKPYPRPALQIDPQSRGRRIDGRLVLYVEHYLNPQYFPRILELDLTGSDRKSTRLNSSHYQQSRMPSSA